MYVTHSMKWQSAWRSFPVCPFDGSSVYDRQHGSPIKELNPIGEKDG